MFRASALVGVLLLLAAPLTIAQSQWRYQDDDGYATLRYGAPDVEDDTRLKLFCEIGNPAQLEVTAFYDLASVEPDQQVSLRLQSGAHQLNFTAQSWLDQNSGDLGSGGAVALDAATRALLASTAPLALSVDGQRVLEIPPLPAPAVQRMLGACGVLPSAALKPQVVSASFDCGQAERPVDRLICSDAVLRWQDTALVRAYRLAREDAPDDAARETLKDAQRAWLKQRDSRCVGAQSWTVLQGDPSRQKAAACLEESDLQRRQVLADTIGWRLDEVHTLQTPPALMPGNAGHLRAQFTPDGRHVLLLTPASEEGDSVQAGQAWRVATDGSGIAQALTPPPSDDPQDDEGIMQLGQIIWQGDGAYIEALLWQMSGDSEDHVSVVYEVRPDGASRRMDSVPAAVRDALRVAALASRNTAAALTDDELDALLPGTLQNSAAFTLWVQDHARGVMTLQARALGMGPATLIAWGGFELRGSVLDARRERVLYPADTGLALFDLRTGADRPLVGTRPGDLPLALSADGRKVVWLRADAYRTEVRVATLRAPAAFATEH